MRKIIYQRVLGVYAITLDFSFKNKTHKCGVNVCLAFMYEEE